jgi:hypothetical protein
LGAITSSDEGFDLVGEFIYIYRLGDVAVTTGIQAALLIAWHGVGRQRYYGHAVEVVNLTQTGGNLVAVNVGQVDIHQNQVGSFGDCDLDTSRAAIGFIHDVALGLEDPLDKEAVLEVVFDVENASWRHLTSPNRPAPSA